MYVAVVENNEYFLQKVISKYFMTKTYGENLLQIHNSDTCSHQFLLITWL